MATEVNQNCFAWPHEESSVQDSSQGTPQVFDHGSISFGRFDLESLAWEKWSVFTNDRRTEEFVKFNGLVAKKKAYFEEYFKRIRELKALQQQNQQTELNLEYSGDGSDSSQTGEDEPAAKHGSPTGSGTLVEDFLEQIAAETTPEHELGCYKDHNESLSNGISSSARSLSLGGLQIIGEETGENASGDNCSHRMDMLQQNAKCSKDDLAMPDVTTENPKRTIEECPRISQASKLIPKTIKITSSYIPGRSFANKGPDASKPIVIHQVAKSGTVQPLRMPKAATGTVVGNTGRSKILAKESPGVIAVRRPSSAASQRPSTRERRPVTRDVSQKPTEMASPCRPSTAERRLATRERAANQTNVATPCRPSTADRRPITKESTPKRANIATPHRPSTADRRPITKESAPKHANVATPHRPSTADRRPITKELAPKHANVATPRRPSTAERRPATREMTPKHFGVANPCWPSTAERHHVTRGTAQKHADLVTLRRPSTAERRPITRETAPKHANVGPSRRPSTAERRPVARDSVLKHANVSSSCWPLTPERRLSRDSPPKPADVAIMPCRPSTGQRRSITKETTLKLDPKTPIRLRAVPGDSNGVMATAVHSNRIAVTPQKAITPNLVKSGKPEIKSYGKERLELQLGGKQKSSSVNLPPRKILTSSHRANRVIEDIRKSNKQVMQETVGSRVFASKSVTPSQTGSVKRVPNPPPPPPPPRRPSQTVSKPSPNKPSGGGRKPKASTPHWH